MYRSLEEVVAHALWKVRDVVLPEPVQIEPGIRLQKTPWSFNIKYIETPFGELKIIDHGLD